MVSDIPAGDGNIEKLLLRCTEKIKCSIDELIIVLGELMHCKLGNKKNTETNMYFSAGVTCSQWWAKDLLDRSSNYRFDFRLYGPKQSVDFKFVFLYRTIASVCLERQYSRSINIVGKDDGIRMGGPRKQVEEVA